MKYILFFILLICGSFYVSAQSYNLQSGINYYNDGNYDAATEYFNREIKQNPKEGKAYFYLTKIHMNNKSYVEALKQVNLAISNLNESDTILARSWITKGDIYMQLSDTLKFESSYAKAIKLFPQFSEVYLERATSYKLWEMYDKAKLDLFKVIELDEADIEARNILCSIYNYEEKYDDVLKHANKILALSPNNSSAYDYRSLANFNLKNYDLAIQDCYTALTLDDQTARLRYNYLIFAKKNYPLAIAKLSTLINEYPQMDIWHLLRAQLYTAKKDFENAVNEFKTIFEIIPVNYHSYYLAQRADLFREMGSHDWAVKDFTKSLEVDSLNAASYAQRGDSYRLLGKYDLSVADFNKAIELEPEEASYYLHRGWVKDEFQKNHEAGLMDYVAAIEIDRNLSYTYLHRGRLYNTFYKDTLRANSDFRKIIELDTSVGSSSNIRHYAFAALGQVGKAKSWMNKILAEYPEDGNYYDAACLYSILKSPKESVAYLDTAFQKGYRDFIHIAKDDDLDNVRSFPEFTALINRWKTKLEKTGIKSAMPAHVEDLQIVGTFIIPFKMHPGGTYEVESKVNGLPLNMTFDTGASDISISQTEVDFMIKNGYLSDRDYVGTQVYNMANGANEESRTILLKRVELGGLVLKNVFASIVDNREAGMLFGQSAMGRFATITIDNIKKQIIISGQGK